MGVLLEGEISGLAKSAALVDFRVGNRLVCIEKTPASARLRDGDRIRVLLQSPVEGPHALVLAFQKRTDSTVHHAGPRTGISLAMLAGALLATGLFAGIGILLIPATSLLLLRLLLAADRDAMLRRFTEG